MKLLMLKSVVSGNRTLKRNTEVEVDKDTAKYYLAVGIAKIVEPIVQKEAKQKIVTKEDKAPARRATKKK